MTFKWGVIKDNPKASAAVPRGNKPSTAKPPTAVPAVTAVPAIVTVPAVVVMPAVVTVPTMMTVPATTAMGGGIGRKGRDAYGGCRDKRDDRFTQHRLPPWFKRIQ